MASRFNRRSLVSNIDHAFDWFRKSLNTSMPGVVRSFDATTGRAVVQPALKVRLVDDTERELPDIADVPVVYPAGGGYSLTFPLAEGDAVLLVFSQRGLTRWKSTLDVSSPDRGVFLSTNDAIAIPGFGYRADDQQYASAVDENSLHIEVPRDGRIEVNHDRLDYHVNQMIGGFARTPPSDDDDEFTNWPVERHWRHLATASLTVGNWSRVDLNIQGGADARWHGTLNPNADLSFRFVVNNGASSVQLISARDLLRQVDVSVFDSSPNSTSASGVVRIVFSEFHDAWVAVRNRQVDSLWVRSEPASEVTIEELTYWVGAPGYHSSYSWR